MSRPIVARIAMVIVLACAAWWLPDLRRALIFDITYWDAPPGEPPQLTGGTGPGLAKTPRTRVVLIDGLASELTPSLPVWSATCRRGLALKVDVGFPTVSLPVEVELWSGLTQQQTGIVHRGGGRNGKYGRPLVPPLRGIPSQIPGSSAIAEDHGWIVRSLGFARALPTEGEDPADDHDPETWKSTWEVAARYAIATPSLGLVFVHILRVDTAGHRFGIGVHYGRIAAEADAILGELISSDPTARWFLLTDHGHIGSHGGEERELRQVDACIAGPGVVAGLGLPARDRGLVHAVDIARAIADSTGATLDPQSHGRPLSAALAAPLTDDQAVPPMELSRGAFAIFLLVAGLGLTAWGTRRWWLAPLWFAIAWGAMVAILGVPTLSLGWIYARDGRAMLEIWVPALVLATAVTWVGLARTTLLRVLAAQLAIPVTALAACITASGGWSAVFGADEAPVVPRYTAWMTVLVLMVASGAAAVALAVLARLVRLLFARRAPVALPRSESEADG